MTPRRPRARRPGGLGTPAVVVPPALLGVLFLLMPTVALLNGLGVAFLRRLDLGRAKVDDRPELAIFAGDGGKQGGESLVLVGVRHGEFSVIIRPAWPPAPRSVHERGLARNQLPGRNPMEMLFHCQSCLKQEKRAIILGFFRLRTIFWKHNHGRYSSRTLRRQEAPLL